MIVIINNNNNNNNNNNYYNKETKRSKSINSYASNCEKDKDIYGGKVIPAILGCCGGGFLFFLICLFLFCHKHIIAWFTMTYYCTEKNVTILTKHYSE